VPPGSALERLILEHQDLDLLRPEEVNDQIGLPPWLRVYWRKQHPELEYRADDPTGGYPRALTKLHVWMKRHPDLRPEPTVSQTTDVASPMPTVEPVSEAAAKVAGTDIRISGNQTTPRSESDIRVNFGDTTRIIAASNAIGASRLAQFFSLDGGATWGQTALSLVLGDTLHSDPTVDWTSDGTAWSTTIGIQGAILQLRAYRSTDGGQTWIFDATFSDGQTAADKQMMWVDHSPISPLWTILT
jgi:hypothetical protein